MSHSEDTFGLVSTHQLAMNDPEDDFFVDHIHHP